MANIIKSFSPVTVATAGSRVPIASAQFSPLTISNVAVTNGQATITTSAPHGLSAGSKVVLYGVVTNTWLNGLRVQVLVVSSTTAFTFVTTHANVASGADSGSVLPSPIQRYRIVRVEIDQGASTNKIFVGDSSVSSSQYAACLTLAGQLSWQIVGEGIDPSDIWIDTSVNSTKVQVSVVY
jgi:hypothetical protein